MNALFSFQQQGFVHLDGLLPDQELRELQQHLELFIREKVPGLPREKVFYDQLGDARSLKQIQTLFEFDDYFHGLMFGSRFENLARELLQQEVIGVNMQYFNKPPLTSQPTPAHQDGYYFMLEPNEAVTLWLAIDATDEENGCVRYLPGSHQQGLRPHHPTGTIGFSQGISDYGESEKTEDIPIHSRAGDLLAHHALTIHRAEENRSCSRQRRAIGLIYYSREARESEEKKARQEELLSDWRKNGKI